MKTTLTMAMAAALALSAGAYAQTSTSGQQSASQSRSAQDASRYDSANRNATTPPSSSTDTNAATMNDDTRLSGTASFDQLDTNHRGYLKRQDLASNKQLAAKFGSCDKNHDGRITREEYDACLSSDSSGASPKY